MFVKYAEITIQVKAQESDMNGPDEIKLSDAIWVIEGELGEWLNQNHGEKFQFEVKAA